MEPLQTSAVRRSTVQKNKNKGRQANSLTFIPTQWKHIILYTALKTSCHQHFSCHNHTLWNCSQVPQSSLLKDTWVLKSMQRCQAEKEIPKLNSLNNNTATQADNAWLATTPPHPLLCCSIFEQFDLACQNVHSWASGWPYRWKYHVYNPHPRLPSVAGSVQSWLFMADSSEYCANCFLNSAHIAQQINSQKTVCTVLTSYYSSILKGWTFIWHNNRLCADLPCPDGITPRAIFIVHSASKHVYMR